MRRKLTGLCLAVLVSFAAGDYLFNRSRGGQDAPKKAEPPEKKDELFDILKKSLEAKSEPGAVPPLPEAPKPADVIVAPLEAPKDKAPPPVPGPLVSQPLPPLPDEKKPDFPQKRDTFPPVNPLPAATPNAPPKDPYLAEADKLLATGNLDQAKQLYQYVANASADPNDKQYATKKLANILQGPAVSDNEVKPRGRKLEPADLLQLPGGVGLPTNPSPPQGPEVKPTIPSLGSSTLPPPVTVVSPVKAKSSPWRLNVEVVEGQTIVTATVNKKHEFKIVCQSLDLQTGTNSFKASGKVQISGDALTGHCERLTISLTDDRLVLEGAAELSIQKTTTTVSSDDGKPAAFELKGETLNLRISELQSGKFLQTSWYLGNGVEKVGQPLPSPQRVATLDERTWSPYGTLRRAKTENGSAWRLENAAGQPILHLVTSGDRVLEQYEGRTISVIGAAVDKMTVRVTHIAVP